MRLTIGIPTRNRPRALSRLLASLSAQTFQDWDLVIVNDSVGDMLDAAGELMLRTIERMGHKVTIAEGARINQTYNHNHVLWSLDTHELILRMDDDIILTPNYIEQLVYAWVELEERGENVAAVSGTIFTEHLWPRAEHPPIPTAQHDSVAVGATGDRLTAWTFMQEYSDDELIETEHLYSSCLYSRDAMRCVGGWPMVYSRGVSYHEETDGTFRLHLAGYKLYLVPAAKAIHSHEGVGGTRLMSPSEHGRRREADWKKFLLRLGKLRGLKTYVPSVALCSQHCSGAGGAERLTYSLLETLVDLHFRGFIGQYRLIPLNDEVVQSVKSVEDNFGIHLNDCDLHYDPEPEIYDIVISLGHVPPEMDEIPPRRHHIHYSLYPQKAPELPKGVDRYVAISEFSANGVRVAYHRNADVVYPYVDFAVDPDGLEKRNWIAIIGRMYGKAVYPMVRCYTTMDLPDGTELHIAAPYDDEGEEATLIKEIAAERGDVHLHIGLSREELSELYGHCAVLWAGRGLGAPDESHEFNREHFGYTPVEALAHYCLPLAYDAGGYCETTLVRWRGLRELEDLTHRALTDKAAWTEMLKRNLDICGRFRKDSFAMAWLRIITSTHAFAWESDIEWRVSDEPEEIAVSSEVHVAVIGDHPEISTGYGVICKEVARGLVDAGYKVHVMGINGNTPDRTGSYASLWPSAKGLDVGHTLNAFLSARDYDAFVVMYDPFISRRLINAIRIPFRHAPVVAFVSQESRPAHSAWADILLKSTRVLTYSKAAASAIYERFGRDKEVGWVHLGVDHAPFRRYDVDTRRAMRGVLGWDNMFVINYVGRNTFNKNIALLMKVISLLHKYDLIQTRLFLHTNPIPDEKFGGIDIDMYAEMLNLNDRKGEKRGVIMSMPPRGEAYAPYECDLEYLFRNAPRTNAEQHEWLMQLGMIARYNLADLYLDLSSAEGFGIPAFEAMACGTPVMMVDDHFVRHEVTDNHVSLIPTRPDAIWTTGADLYMADAVDVFRRVSEFVDSGDGMFAIVGDDARKIVSGLKWDNVRAAIVDAVRSCLI